MQLKVEITKIKCNRTTVELSSDEVYCGLKFFTGSKVNGDFVPDKNSTKVAASEAQRNVKKGTTWKPQNNEFIFDLNGNNLFGLIFSLYEQDDGIYHEKLLAGDTDEVLGPFDFSSINFPQNPANWADWIAPVIKLLQAVFLFTKQDNEIGSEPFAYKIDDPNLSLGKSFGFKKLFANYEVLLNLSLINN